MISVLIPNWNGKRFLKGCLGSLKNQTFKDFETILIDNGSTDHSIKHAQSIYPDLQILSLKRNFGFAKAVNEGILKARGELIALLNNDAIADANWLEELLKGIESSERIGSCASKILRAPGGEEIDTAGDGYSYFGVARKRGNLLNKKCFARKELVFGACAAAALYRRSMLREIGFFDENLFCLYEDVDLSFRAQIRGYLCLYVPTAVVYHWVGGTLGTNNSYTVYYGQRNLEIVWLANMPGRILLKYLLFHILYNIFILSFYIFKKNGSLVLKSKRDVLKRISLVLEKRKNIQNQRRVSIDYLLKIMDKYSLWQHIARSLSL